MGKKLYVGNLSFTISEAALLETFSQFGEVESAKIITDRDSGRSKGFGFVEFAADEAAQEAITKMNGSEYEGRKVVVSEARPQAPREGGGGRGGFGGGRGGGGGFGGGRGGGNRGGGRGGFRGSRD
jgi:RNA recognition motif-containing protein